MYFDTHREAATRAGRYRADSGSPGNNAPYARRAHRGNRRRPRCSRPHRQSRRLPDPRRTRRTTQLRIEPRLASSARCCRSSFRTPPNGPARSWHIHGTSAAVRRCPPLSAHPADQPQRSTDVRRRPAVPDFQAGHAGSIPVTRSRSSTFAVVRARPATNARTACRQLSGLAAASTAAGANGPRVRLGASGRIVFNCPCTAASGFPPSQ